MGKNEVAEVQTTDLSADDQKRVQEFLEGGAEGFNLADEVLITKMMDLYLAGKTYSQISRINRKPKVLVMAYSQRLNWFRLKADYLLELELHLKGRLVNAKVASQDFLLQMQQMYQKKIGAKMDHYLQTGNDSVADSINLKEIDKYLKIVESLHKLSATPNPKNANPAVGLNLGDGVTITKKDDNSVEITPKQKTIGSMLEQLANQRREAEVSKYNKTSDIKEVTPQQEGEKGNEKE